MELVVAFVVGAIAGYGIRAYISAMPSHLGGFIRLKAMRNRRGRVPLVNYGRKLTRSNCWSWLRPARARPRSEQSCSGHLALWRLA
jgi:hypothetical protein